MRNKKTLLFLTHLLIVVCVLSQQLIPVSAAAAATSDHELNNKWGYFTYLYNNSNGLIASEANAVAQIGIGFIWIGGYSGLTRYDGNEFTHFDISGLASVNCL